MPSKTPLTSIEPLLRGDDAVVPRRDEPDRQRELRPARRQRTRRIEAGASLEQEVVLGVWDLVFSSSADELDVQVEATVGAITAPYSALHGADPGPDYPDWLRTHIARSTLEVWPDDGHFPHLVEPERFLDRLHDFAHGVDAP